MWKQHNCPECNGNGWTATMNASGLPVQEQCFNCTGTGIVSMLVLKRYSIRLVSEGVEVGRLEIQAEDAKQAYHYAKMNCEECLKHLFKVSQ